MILHCFCELDIETEQKLSRELFQKLWEMAEATGFFCDQKETELIQFSGPFNIPDWYLDVSFNLLWNITRVQIKEAYWLFKKTPDGIEERHDIYHFLSLEGRQMEDFTYA